MHLWPRGWSVDSYIIKMIFFLMNIDQHMDSYFSIMDSILKYLWARSGAGLSVVTFGFCSRRTQGIFPCALKCTCLSWFLWSGLIFWPSSMSLFDRFTNDAIKKPVIWKYFSLIYVQKQFREKLLNTKSLVSRGRSSQENVIFKPGIHKVVIIYISLLLIICDTPQNLI